MSLTAHKQLETISHLGKKVLCSIQSWRKVFKSGEELGQSIICKRFFDGTGLAFNSANIWEGGKEFCNRGRGLSVAI